MTDLYPAPEEYDQARNDRLCDLAASGDWLVVGHGADPAEAAWIAADWRDFCVDGAWPAFEFEVRGVAVWGRFVGTRCAPPTKKRTGRTWSTGNLRVRRERLYPVGGEK